MLDEASTAEEWAVAGMFMTGVYTSIICSYCCVQDDRKTPALQLAFYFYLCELCFSAGLVAQWWREDYSLDESCRTLSLWNQFFIFATVLWFGVMSVNLYVTLKNPWTKYARVGPLYHCFIWGTSSGLALHLNYAEKYGVSASGLCWVRKIGPVEHLNTYKWGVCFMPLVVIFLISCGLNLLAYWHVRHSRKKFDTLEDRFQKGNAKYLFATRNSRYTLVFGVCLGLNGLFYCLSWQADFQNRDYQAGFVGVFFLRPILDLIVWGANTGLLKRLRYLVYRSWLRRQHSAYQRTQSEIILIEPMIRDPQLSKEDPDLSASLREDMMYLTRAGIQTAVLGNARRNTESDSAIEEQFLSMRDLRRTEIQLSPGPIPGSGSGSPRKQPKGKGSASRDLRQREDAQYHKQQSSTSALLQQAEDERQSAFKIDYYIPVVDDNENMSVPASGMRQAAMDSSPKRPRYQHLYKHSRVRFTDHAPQAFRELRRLAGISDKEFVGAFGLQGHMREAGSAGKSGDVFYFTQNMQFLVKTLPPHEVRTLKALLPHYLRHIRLHPSSLLLRFLGLYTVQLPFSQQSMYFVVMQNVLLGQNGEQIHETFDLKGNLDPNRRTRLPKGCGLRLDLDLRDDIQAEETGGRSAAIAVGMYASVYGAGGNQSQLLLSPDNRRHLLAQLEVDCGFLYEHNLIDYSLLLGVHRADQQQPSPGERSASFDATGLQHTPSSELFRGRGRSQVLSETEADRASSLAEANPQEYDERAREGEGEDGHSGRADSGDSVSLDLGSPSSGGSLRKGKGKGRDASAQNTPTFSFLRNLNALPSTDLRSVYYVGIIDILASYSWRWALQRYALCLFVCKTPNEVTAVPARQYAKRLFDFVNGTLIAGGDDADMGGGDGAGDSAGGGGRGDDGGDS